MTWFLSLLIRSLHGPRSPPWILQRPWHMESRRCRIRLRLTISGGGATPTLETMKRYIAAVLSILGVAAGVGWKLASHPETSLGLHEVSLKKNSERSLPSNAVARLRIRVSPSDLGYALRVSPDKVPQVSLAAK